MKNKEIAEYRNLSVNQVDELYKKAVSILKNRDEAWLYGLSTRAKLALIASEKYSNFKDLYSDIMDNNADLECLPKVGHKVAIEIRGWAIAKSK